jgi:hypothetical protein
VDNLLPKTTVGPLLLECTPAPPDLDDVRQFTVSVFREDQNEAGITEGDTNYIEEWDDWDGEDFAFTSDSKSLMSAEGKDGPEDVMGVLCFDRRQV